MNVISSGPHILLFERDHQLVTLLSGELAQAGYEVHTARTAVEVFDAIARYSVRLVMVNLAQAQAGRREFWVALDAQRRGRGVQVFTFRCTNIAGYGPDDPDERVDTVLTDLEVDGMMGVMKLVEAVRTRVPSAVPPPAPSMPVRSVPVMPPPVPTTSAQGNTRLQPSQELPQLPPSARPVESVRSGLSTFTDKIRAVIYPGGRNVASTPDPTWPPNPPLAQSQLAVPTQQPDVLPQAPVNQRMRNAEYPPSSYHGDIPYQAPPHDTPFSQEQTSGYVAPVPTERKNGSTPVQNALSSSHPGVRIPSGESSLDQLSRMLHDKRPVQQNTLMNGNMQNTTAYTASGLDVDQQELQAIRTQIIRAAQLDEAYERSMLPQQPLESPQLRVSPIQDTPLEREGEYRRLPNGFSSDSPVRSALTAPPSAQSWSSAAQFQAYQASPAPTGQQPVVRPSTYQASPASTSQQPVVRPSTYQASPAPTGQQPVVRPSTYQASPTSTSQQPSTYSPSSGPARQLQMRPNLPMRDQSSETAFTTVSHAAIKSAPPQASLSGEVVEQQKQPASPLILEGLAGLPEHIQASLQQKLAHRPDVTTSDDMLLDIVKSLPPMTPASPLPEPPPVLNGRATRSLGSVLLEGHLVPEERLQVAQHVQRMMRGVDLNYQLGEILLMFKLLTPDQLLAASLVSYGMISTMQISALGRIRQELHAIGLEYDLESLVILFRILTPEQMREVRASWSS